MTTDQARVKRTRLARELYEADSVIAVKAVTELAKKHKWANVAKLANDLYHSDLLISMDEQFEERIAHYTNQRSQITQTK